MNREDVDDLIRSKNKVIEELETMVDTILEEPWFTEECPLSCAPEGEIENRIIHICGCYNDGYNCENYKECWLKYFERKIKDERNAR